ncbi:MAG TPA: hypothetical protein VLX28_28575 [Thermoanaerobaculia bacterium]|nr:hypothetical protein [Thermoanaerobaculia bacterium]
MEKENQDPLLALLKKHEQVLHRKHGPQEQVLRLTAQFLRDLALSTIVPVLARHDVTPDLIEKEALKFLRRLFRVEQPRRPLRGTETSSQRAGRGAAAERGARLRAAVKSRPALEAEISSLDRLGDAALWNAAQTRMPQPDSERMEELHRKQRLTGLSEAEAQELGRLEQQYDRVILVRSHSALLLKERGHDIQGLSSGIESRRPKNGQTRSAIPGG